MGNSPSSPSLAEASEVVVSYLMDAGIPLPSNGHCAVFVTDMLADGTVSDVCENRLLAARRKSQRQPLEEDYDASLPLLGCLLRLDPHLAEARYRCVPRLAHESVWWKVYLESLCTVATQELPSLSRRAEAVDSLRALTSHQPVGVGALAALTVLVLCGVDSSSAITAFPSYPLIRLLRRAALRTAQAWRSARRPLTSQPRSDV